MANKKSYKKLNIDLKDLLFDYRAGVSGKEIDKMYFIRSRQDRAYILKKAGITDGDRIKRLTNILHLKQDKKGASDAKNQS